MAGSPGPVGAYNNINDPKGTWDPGTTFPQAFALWNNQTGTLNQCGKVFYNEGVFPTSPDPQLSAMIAQGVNAMLCYKPRFDTAANMATDLALFDASLHALARAGATGYVIPWQEPQNSPDPPFPTAAQFVSLLEFDPAGTGIGAFHASANAHGFQFYYDAASHSPSKWATYMPPPAPGGQYIDGVAVDFYYSSYVGGTRIHGTGSIMALADAVGLPFGVFEIGLTAGGTASVPTPTAMANYLNYLVQIMGNNPAGTVNGESLPAGRLHQGKANGPVMWFNGAFHQSINQIVPVANATAGATAVYCVNTGYPMLYAALSAGGSGGTTANAGLATGTGAALGASVVTSGGVSVSAGLATATGAALSPAVVTPPPPPAAVAHTPAIPGRAQPGGFSPGRQGVVFPVRPLGTAATPGQAQPGTFSPGDPGPAAVAQPPPPPPQFSDAIPGVAQPGTFTPGLQGTAGAPPPPLVPFVAQQLSQAATYNYGWSAIEFSGNAPGNMLVVMAGWDLNATGTSAPMPAVYVCDSALNYWYHAGTTTASNTGSRCSIWVAPNANPVEWVSCSPTTFTSSLAYTVLEIGNAPQFCTIDISSATSDLGNTVLDASPGRTGSADLGLACLVRGSTVGGLTTGPAGWTGLGEVQAGFGVPNAVSLYPFWVPSVPAGTNEIVRYTNSHAAPLSAVTVLIEASPNPPVQPDPNFPVLKVEAAFGFLAGDPTQSPPGPPGAASGTIWTDITARCAAKDGTPFLSPVLGKSYELAQPETGELAISCDNHDGAFTPGNASSPYAPGTGVQLGTPVRVSACWGGSWFNVAFGYVERWPTEFPDVPQWGMSAMIAADAFSALSAAVSYSALNGDLLLDAPYALIPCNEQYTTQSNSLVPLRTPSECQGLLAANIARFNQRPGTYVDGTGAQCATGQSTTLLGSQDTGFGCSQFTAPLTLTSSGPGMIYWDPALPSPLAASGLSVEFWLTVTAASATANVQPTVFTAFGAASNYQTGHPNLQIQVQNSTGNNILQVTFADGTTMTAPFAPTPNPQQVVLVFGGGTVSLFVNGALSASTALTATQVSAWQAVMLGCGNYAYHNGTLVGGVFTAMSLAIYPYQLPLQRIVSHYVTGVSGQQNVDATTRIAQVLAWTSLGIPRGGRVTFNGVPAPVLQGPAYSLSGANVSSALNQAAANEQGLLFASPDGTLQFAHRWALFNQAPSAVFGDNTALGEIPFLPGQAFDYDNSYLFNIVKATQATGATTGITVTSTDTNSQAAYFNRSVLAVGIQTMSNLDAYDLANQAIATYSQPQIRLRGLTVDAASNPQIAFPAVLGLQQGNAATVNRRPAGGVPISASVIVQKVSHIIGPKIWQTSYEMSPYGILGSVLQLDEPLFDVISQNSLP